MKEEITIIGAGIGGLTMALALQKTGYRVKIYESTSEIRPVGAGILMANNAMQIFDKLDVRKKIEKRGHKVSSIKITDAQLKHLSETELDRYEDKYGVFNVALHRSDLQQILAEEIGHENMELSKHLLKIEDKDGFELTFADGTEMNCKIVIGADGINSTVRNQIFSTGTTRDSKQRCWRGVCKFDSDSKYNHKAYEAWGKGKRFGFTKISDHKLYWYAVMNENLLTDDLESLFKEFHPDISDIIYRTDRENRMLHSITDLKPFTDWHQGKLCLIGDAAHATTPNMGQGACQAVEDAYVISRLLDEGKRIEEAFSEYGKIRLKKAHYIVNTSRLIGKVSHYENNIAVFLRNSALKMIPKLVASKQMDKVFDINY